MGSEKSENLMSARRSLPKMDSCISDIDYKTRLDLCKLLSHKSVLSKLKACPDNYTDARLRFYRFESDTDAKDVMHGDQLLNRWGEHGYGGSYTGEIPAGYTMRGCSATLGS